MIDKTFEVNRLTAEAIQAGAWFWFKAEGQSENLQSAMMRMHYSRCLEALKALGAPTPAPEVVYSAAEGRWPANRLHGRPKAMAAKVNPEVGA